MRAIAKYLAVIVILLMAVGSYSGQAADIYLELGPIKGDCREPGHEEAIVIDSFSYGTSQSGMPGKNAGRRGRTSTEPGVLQFSKSFDSSSPLILQFLWSGSVLAGDATISANAGSGDTVRVMKMTLSEVTIASYSLTGDKKDLRENITLQYGKLKVECQQIGKTVDATLDLTKEK